MQFLWSSAVRFRFPSLARCISSLELGSAETRASDFNSDWWTDRRRRKVRRLRPSFFSALISRISIRAPELFQKPMWAMECGDPKYGECASVSNYALNFKNRHLFASVKAMFSSINLSFSRFSIIFSLWFRGIDWPTPNRSADDDDDDRSIDTRSINLLESIRFFFLFISFLVRLGSSSVLPGWIPAKRLPTATI